jgi:hypothetical protein
MLAALFVAVAAGNAAFRWCHAPERVRRRALGTMPRRDVIDCTDGTICRVVGAVRLFQGETVSAPLTGRLCVASVVRVYRPIYGRRETQLVLLHEEAKSVPFLVNDRTGPCLVRSVRTSSDLAVDTSDMADRFSVASSCVRQFLECHPELEPVPSTSIIFQEARLEAGDVVAVIGGGRWEIQEIPSGLGDQGYREARQYEERLIFEGAQLSDDLSCVS